MWNEYRVRFEHGRGHRMVLEGEPAIGREEIDELQCRMLRWCEIPGLLELETEELDGAIALRYSLSGRRMLSQAMRSAKWRMEDALTALCRLAEALELGREYMLDAERYVLDDDYIFVGDGWHDLAFTYLPLRRQTAGLPPAAGIERLIVRWMMHVETPDGKTMQQLLRLTASPDFAPAMLLRFARSYLAEGAVSAGMPEGLAGGGDRFGASASAAVGDPARLPYAAASSLEAEGDRKSASVDGAAEAAGHREEGAPWFSNFRRAGGNSQGLSEWLGEEEAPLAAEEAPAVPPDAESLTRWRIWLASGAAALTAGVWRFAYLPYPGSRELGISAAMTLLAAGGCIWLWNGRDRRAGGRPRRSAEADRDADRAAEHLSFAKAVAMPEFEAAFGREREASNDRLGQDGHPGRRPTSFDSFRGEAAADDWRAEVDVADAADAGTSWLGAPADGTRLLDHATAAGEEPFRECYLEWDTSDGRRKIRLSGRSLVIGRSKEAAQHVDHTEGVSRAHLELIRGEANWQARDLGSRNGSWLNGVPMAPYEAYPLTKGDSIQIASSLYRYGEG